MDQHQVRGRSLSPISPFRSPISNYFRYLQKLPLVRHHQNVQLYPSSLGSQPPWGIRTEISSRREHGVATKIVPSHSGKRTLLDKSVIRNYVAWVWSTWREKRSVPDAVKIITLQRVRSREHHLVRAFPIMTETLASLHSCPS
jgi:hypothetical protein